MVDSDAFSNAIRLKVFLITGFLRILLSLVLLSGEFKITKEFTASYKNKRSTGRITHPRKPFKSLSLCKTHYIYFMRIDGS